MPDTVRIFVPSGFGSQGRRPMPCARVEIDLAFGFGHSGVHSQRHNFILMGVSVNNVLGFAVQESRFFQCMAGEGMFAAPHFLFHPDDYIVDGCKGGAPRKFATINSIASTISKRKDLSASRTKFVCRNSSAISSHTFFNSSSIGCVFA